MNQWIRQTHRWISVVFTAAVIANIVAQIKQVPAVWIGMLALFPLIILLLTGLYLFVLPYVVKGRRNDLSTGAERAMDR